MRILITNDDGIGCEGILSTVRWAQQHGEVVVVAPKQEQSGKSQAIDIHAPFEIKQADLLPGVLAYSVDSTPADCVRYATVGLGLSYDLVISGVNRGLNIGEDIVYSGTCGAIFEAAYAGCNAIAFSTDPSTYEGIEEGLERAYQFIISNDLFAYSKIYNVNIPLSPKGIRVTRQGGPYYKDRFVHQGNDMYLADGFSVYKNTRNLDLDTDASMNGYISITPLSVSRTDHEAFFRLAGLNQ